ncbi:hypothetical protein [Roseibacillus ishigakijimensis]|uniref:OmpA-like domain-containing protein n=1 Tax=Roseibacillus ishigakijimensis TaxID=454146 RepID=A0A934RK12_9BACT|nr:hypothetical protein [Roseibacillus ishigakijimensis]MBK1833122.1 hypothetical protein [Roseibacillus ishigakijimensis]
MNDSHRPPHLATSESEEDWGGVRPGAGEGDPPSGETWQALRSLLLGKEITELEALRQKLAQTQSPEWLAQNLAEALRRRKEEKASFDELVAALQAGTESAIQRSVNLDKEPLTKALFPIMGPAIRSYVLDLFRGMAEELNRSIQNATSAERLKWRVQAKMAGKPYSEFVLLKTRSFRIEEVYLMQRDTGLLLLHAALNPANEVDGEADVVSGMFTAIRSFVKDSFARGRTSEDGDDEELGSFTFGDREVLIEVGPSLVLAAVVHGVPSREAREKLKEIHEHLHGELQPLLENFSGDTSELERARPVLRTALIERRVEKGQEKGGRGLWRVWLFLALVAAFALAVIAVNLWEQRRWDHYESSLRAEPGLAVTAVERTGWWRQRLVRGVRDPLAADPAALAEKEGLNLTRIRFDFDSFTSAEEPFVTRREATLQEWRRDWQADLAELKRELASSQEAQEEARRLSERKSKALLESLWQDIPALESRLTEGTLFLAGDLTAAELALVERRIIPLQEGWTIDTTGLGNRTQVRMDELVDQIEGSTIRYVGGTLENEDVRHFEAKLAQIVELSELMAAGLQELTIQLTAHPLIGENREPNRLVEEKRLQHVEARLREEGWNHGEVEASLSEDLSQAGEGISVRIEKRND